MSCERCAEIQGEIEAHVDADHPGSDALIVSLGNARRAFVIIIAIGFALGFWFAKA